jgi:hypothetical protein
VADTSGYKWRIQVAVQYKRIQAADTSGGYKRIQAAIQNQIPKTKDIVIGMDLRTGINDEERDEETRDSSTASTSTSQASHQVNVAVVTPSKRPLKKKKNVAKQKYKLRRIERRLEMTDMSGVAPVVCCLCKELAAQDLFLFCNICHWGFCNSCERNGNVMVPFFCTLCFTDVCDDCVPQCSKCGKSDCSNCFVNHRCNSK